MIRPKGRQSWPAPEMGSFLKPWIRRGLAAAAQTVSWAPRRLRGRACILTYHRVLPADQVSAIGPQPGMYVTTDAFAEHVRFLADNFRVLPFAALLNAWQNGSFDSREPQCVITFDDGWIDTYEQAFPLLQRYQLPATVFLPTAFVGTNEWFWPDQLLHIFRNLDRFGQGDIRDTLRLDLGVPARNGSPFGDATDDLIERCKDLPVADRQGLLRRFSGPTAPPAQTPQVVDWPAVEVMSRSGVTFGSHTHTHPILTQLSDADVSTELSGSLRVLSRQNINALPVLAYPNGSFDARVAALAQRCGYQAAVSTRFGFERDRPSDILGIRRIGIHQGIASSAALFAYHIAGGNRVLSWA
jgi:peptidoglycan/xylan/chitin deacetylase (PgdA/CDA1 family)